MLGSTMFNYFVLKSNLEIWGTYRSGFPPNSLVTNDRSNLIPLNLSDNEGEIHALVNRINPVAIINCVGLIKQRTEIEDVLKAVPINTLLSHQLQIVAKNVGAKLIHFSTDCVFSGAVGNYSEEDTPDAKDIYGLTKYLGEVTGENSLTLRTSIIGHEIRTKLSLLEWFLSQEKEIEGYTGVFFSGLPTNEVARVVLDILEEHSNLSGMYHLSAERISKYDLLSIINTKYKKNLEIHRSEKLKIDRSLNSEKLGNRIGYKPRSWDRLIEEMKEFKDECDRYF